MIQEMLSHLELPPMGPGHEYLDHNNIINDSAKMKSEKLTYEINRY